MVSWRAALTAHAVLTEDEAVAALPVDGEAARAWLRASVRPRTALAGVQLYVWGDVVDALSAPERAAAEWIDTAEAARRLGLSRSSLDAMLRRAPPDLPGAPVTKGEGGERQHRLWDAGRLLAWRAAYEAHRHASATAAAARLAEEDARRKASRAEGPVDWRKVGRRR